MRIPAVHEYGPYTLCDLDALSEDGKGYELAEGWLTELPASAWHDHGAGRFKEILEAAAARAGADVYVAGGPNDVTTPAGIRKPDVFVVPRDVARSAIGRRVRAYYVSDLLLVAEVVSPRSGSEGTDRVQKTGEYAKAGIPLYWIIELDPDLKITVLSLGEDAYELAAEARAGHVLSVEEPFPVSFDPVALTELD